MNKMEKIEQKCREIAVFPTKHGDLWLRARGFFVKRYQQVQVLFANKPGKAYLLTLFDSFSSFFVLFANKLQMGDLRNKLRKLTRIFFTEAYHEYDFGTEDEINVPSGIRF